MDIRDKLKFLDQIHKPTYERPDIRSSEYVIEQVIDGEFVETPHGAVFARTIEFDLDFQHGFLKFEKIIDLHSEFLQLAGKDENLSQINLQRALFFDTETTGLSGGSGTRIFLAGFGYFEKDKFVVQQFFMRDFPEEPAMLRTIFHLLKRFDTIISFNGKSYDWPLLNERFIFHRIKNQHNNLPHLDLLHASRRIWKNRLTDCSLGTIEREVLQIYRNGDVPSYLIPHLYFEYLRSKDARPLKPVFYHNKIDILSLVSLTILLHQIHQSPLQELTSTLDLETLARYYENINQWEKNVIIYQKLIEYETDINRKKLHGIQLGFCYKRIGKLDKAVQLWRELLKTGNFHIEPYEELAKYYEHHTRDFTSARDIVELALKNLAIIEQLNHHFPCSFFRERLNYRLNRLLTKLQHE